MVLAAIPAYYVCVLQPKLHVDIRVAVQHTGKAGRPSIEVIPKELTETTSHERFVVLYYLSCSADSQRRCLSRPLGLQQCVPAGRYRQRRKVYPHETRVWQRNGFEASSDQSLPHICLAWL